MLNGVILELKVFMNDLMSHDFLLRNIMYFHNILVDNRDYTPADFPMKMLKNCF